MKTLFVFCSVFIFTSDLISALTQADFPRPGACGTQIKDRIFGGELTSIVDYPWYALLYYPTAKERKINPLRNFLCGGVLINKNYVLTAAHCILSRGKPSFVRLGEHDLRTPEDCENGECADDPQDVAVTEWIVHEQYRRIPKNGPHDIGLLRLERDIETTDWVRPICLPFGQDVRSKNFDRVSMIIAGYGKTKTTRSSSVLLKLEIEGVNFNRCVTIYRNYTNQIQLNPKQLCAGGVPGQDSCNGDSGGPLMGEVLTSSPNAPPYTYVAGIVSFGPSKCGTAGVPGVYTRVDQYLDWILNKMKL